MQGPFEMTHRIRVRTGPRIQEPDECVRRHQDFRGDERSEAHAFSHSVTPSPALRGLRASYHTSILNPGWTSHPAWPPRIRGAWGRESTAPRLSRGQVSDLGRSLAKARRPYWLADVAC